MGRRGPRPDLVEGLERRALAHLFLAAAEIRARAAALSVLPDREPLFPEDASALPRMRASSFSRESIFSLTLAALLSCCGDKLINEFIGVVLIPNPKSQARRTNGVCPSRAQQRSTSGAQ